MTRLSDLLTALGVGYATEVLAEYWDRSESTFPDERPRFLDPKIIAETREFARLPAEVDSELHEAARRIAASPELLHLAWHCHCLVYEHLDYEASRIRQWPILTEALGERSGVFYLLIGFDAISRMRAVHEQLGIPEQVTRDSCYHYTESTRIYSEHHDGQLGILPRPLYWLRNHIKGDLYRLGRHEYMVKPFRGKLKAYRHRETRRVIALAADGERFDAEGFVARPDSPDAWCATLTETPEHIVGFPIAPHGHAVNRKVTLPLGEWDLALSPGDTILEVHIPAGGNMTRKRCQDSMQQALEFFPRYFPDETFVGFACTSWILNPQLKKIYRPDSNMVLWQRELYLFPVASGDRSGVYFIFGEDDVDVDSAARDTSLRRALLDHIAAGGRLISGGMFMLLEDFERFGTQVYREQEPVYSVDPKEPAMPPALSDPIASGATADVFAYGEGRVLKLFRTRAPSHRTELLATRTAYEAGLSVPEVVGDELVEIEDREGIVFERVDGPTMLEYLQAHPEDADACGRTMAKLHAQIHSCEARALPRLHEILVWSVNNAKPIDPDTRDAVLDILRALPDGQTLCHNDLYPQNLILSDRGWVVIDWAIGSRGNPVADYARTWLISRLWSDTISDAPEPVRDMVQCFWSAYLDGYLERRPIPADEFRRWQTVAAAVSLCWDPPQYAPTPRLSFIHAALDNTHHPWLD